MKNRHRMRDGASLCILLGAAALPLDADIVELQDGRRYEGRILSRGERVRIDTVVGRTRCSLGFPAAEVRRIEEKPIPPAFFDAPRAAERISDPTKFQPDQPLYLEIPIVGRLGEAVFSDGIADVLNYARRHGIQHIVFDVDSDGGDIDEAVEIYDLLRAARGPLKYHVIARHCLGPALVFPFWASTVNILPGGHLGPPKGPEGEKETAVIKKGKEEVELTRAQIAYKVITETGRTGLAAEILRAIVDPDHQLAIWRGEDGKIEHDAVLPDGVPPERVIVNVPRGTRLDLSHEQAQALGMKELEGGPAGLGKLLGLEGWAKESDYGAKAIESTSAARRKARQAKQAQHDTQVKNVKSRRETVQGFISHSLQEAARWDPTKASYETYSFKYDWGWGWSYDYAEKKYTLESQKRWKSLTDACMYYIQNAAQGLKQMKGLEEQAVKLGLDPLYKPGEIDNMLQDLNVRYKLLGEHRNKAGA